METPGRVDGGEKLGQSTLSTRRKRRFLGQSGLSPIFRRVRTLQDVGEASFQVSKEEAAQDEDSD